MTDFVSRPAFRLGDLRQRRRAPAPTLLRRVRDATFAWAKARAPRRDFARLAEMPDYLLEDMGLLRHPEIVSRRELEATAKDDDMLPRGKVRP